MNHSSIPVLMNRAMYSLDQSEQQRVFAFIDGIAKLDFGLLAYARIQE